MAEAIYRALSRGINPKTVPNLILPRRVSAPFGTSSSSSAKPAVVPPMHGPAAPMRLPIALTPGS